MKLGSAFFGQWIDGLYSVVNDYGIAIILNVAYYEWHVYICNSVRNWFVLFCFGAVSGDRAICVLSGMCA